MSNQVWCDFEISFLLNKNLSCGITKLDEDPRFPCGYHIAMYIVILVVRYGICKGLCRGIISSIAVKLLVC
jgi:hypothetical protein